jgi:light-regulated signal transduction histidine kinase (bacteriophytochrome)
VEVLVKQNDDLEQFAYIVSHNLRSPIAQILGLTNLFRGEQNAENQELIEMLRNSAKNLDIVIKDLNHVLDIKTQHSKQYEEVNVIEVLKLTLKKFEQELQDKKVRINMKVDENISTIYAVKEYVENIIYQYISNAIKFRKLHKTLVLEIELHQNFTHIVFLVADNGLGIYDTKKIFKLYQRQHLEIEGKGLNLFLVKTQMELLGGEVSVESIEGKGSIFTACFKIKS